MYKPKAKTKQKKILKGSRGITLIALVITIIVLLILAAVSIATLTGENGILSQADKAGTETKVKREKEQIGLSYNAVMTANKGTGVTEGQLEDELQKYDSGATVVAEGENFKVTFPNGDVYTVDGKTGEITGPINSGRLDPVNPPPSVVGKLAKDVLKINLDADDDAEDYERSPYVKYNNILCRVFYNEEYVDGRHGLQIISADNEGEVTLGNDDDFEESRRDYNNAVDILNNKAKSYLSKTEKIAVDARSLGSVATLDGEKFKSGSEFSGSFGNYGCFDGQFIEEDSFYVDDERQLYGLDLYSNSDRTWLASRYFDDGVDQLVYEVRYVSVNGITGTERLCNIQYTSGYEEEAHSGTCGFRPVFLLSPDVKVKGGTGTEDDPYELEL